MERVEEQTPPPPPPSPPPSEASQRLEAPPSAGFQYTGQNTSQLSYYEWQDANSCDDPNQLNYMSQTASYSVVSDGYNPGQGIEPPPPAIPLPPAKRQKTGNQPEINQLTDPGKWQSTGILDKAHITAFGTECHHNLCTVDDSGLTIALGRINAHIGNPKKFLKASALLRQLFTGEQLSGAHGDLVFQVSPLLINDLYLCFKDVGICALLSCENDTTCILLSSE